MNRQDPNSVGRRKDRTRRGRCCLVLLVDDDPEMRSAIRLILPKQYQVVALAGGEEFIEMVQAYQPDLIMLDIGLPGRDGFKLCRELRGRTDFCRIPILFLAAVDEGAGSMRGRDAGGDAYLMKPFEPQELLETIERLLDDSPP